MSRLSIRADKSKPPSKSIIAAMSGETGLKALNSELVVLFDHRSKIWKKKYQIERN